MKIKVKVDGTEIEVDWRPPQLAALRERWPTGLVSIDLEFTRFSVDTTGAEVETASAYAGDATITRLDNKQFTIEDAVAELIAANEPEPEQAAKLLKVAELRARADKLEAEVLQLAHKTKCGQCGQSVMSAPCGPEHEAMAKQLSAGPVG